MISATLPGPKDWVVHNGNEALAVFRDELTLEGNILSSIEPYIKRTGEFFLGEPIKVSALIRGEDRAGQPCVYVVYKTDLSHYVQAAEILAKEFIPLGIKNKETAYLAWSE